MQNIVNEFVEKYSNEPWFVGVGCGTKIGAKACLVVFYKNTKPKINTFMAHNIIWQKTGDIKSC